MPNNIKLLEEIDFLDLKVKVYFHPDYSHEENKNTIQTAWQAKNPDSYYQGIMYLNHETGKITYPEGAIIPEQTEKDREIIPKFIIIGESEISHTTRDKIKEYLEKEYKYRNKKELN